jgi:thiol-disulfide isomerase/thioredoxin
MDKNIKIFVIVIVLLLVGIGAAVFLNGGTAPAGPGAYDDFAKCLADKGLVFYGAFWCPHCQAQKKMFGNSTKYLPYIECSTPDGNGQTQICKDKGVESYPDWRMPDGTKILNDDPGGGGVKLETLAAKSGCALPANE